MYQVIYQIHSGTGNSKNGWESYRFNKSQWLMEAWQYPSFTLFETTNTKTLAGIKISAWRRLGITQQSSIPSFWSALCTFWILCTRLKYKKKIIACSDNTKPTRTQNYEEWKKHPSIHAQSLTGSFSPLLNNSTISTTRLGVTSSWN